TNADPQRGDGIAAVKWHSGRSTHSGRLRRRWKSLPCHGDRLRGRSSLPHLRPEPGRHMRPGGHVNGLVWYVSYGSNLSAERFHYYIRGGRPPGAARTYPGARDRALPRADEAVWLPG